MSLTVSRILHAGYIFESQNVKIAFDPIFESPFCNNCFAFPVVEFDLEQIQKLKLDAVFISHYHDDHCSFDSLKLLDRNTPIYLFCVYDELSTLIRELGFINVHSLVIDQSLKLGPFEIITRRALEVDVDSIFQIKVDGLNILNVVDSWIDPETVELLCQQGPWDLILWPFQTMRELEILDPRRAMPSDRMIPIEWIDQLKLLNPKALVPSSCQFKFEEWSWYNEAFFPISYSSFQRQISNILPNTELVRMNPGVTIEINSQGFQFTNLLSWINPVGEQNSDYKYHAKIKPPATREIAKHLSTLSKENEEIVRDYCHHELEKRFEELPISEETYFHTEKLWNLALYKNDGNCFEFNYIISKRAIRLVEESQLPLGWKTEIPIVKLFGALSMGEALTSLYVRINDFRYIPEVEKQILAVDLFEDPLLRCLFNGKFASYQKAQLKRIIESKKRI